MPRDYRTYPELSALYLADSFVLEIVELPAEFRFKLEAVLTRDHPAYRDSLPGEHHCYANGQLVFPSVTKVDWITQTFQRSTDAAGEIDLGNIDSLTNDDDVFSVEGDWGRVRIWSNSSPRFILD